jgi:hypothetical protein
MPRWQAGVQRLHDAQQETVAGAEGALHRGAGSRQADAQCHSAAASDYDPLRTLVHASSFAVVPLRLPWLLLPIPFLSACAAPGQPSPRFSSLQLEAKTLCEVMDDPSRYAGRRVVMKGLYLQDPHHRRLYDAHCPEWDFSVSESFDVAGDPAAERLVKRGAKKDPTVSIPVVYVGTFTMGPFLIGCSERDCFHYSLEDSQLLAASPR